MKVFRRAIDRFRFLFVAMFVAFAAGTGGYWMFVQRPAQACEAAGNWWDGESRVCGTVVYLPDLTGRYEIGGREWRPAVAQSAPTSAASRPAS